VHYLINGDYSEESEADKLIKSFILSYKSWILSSMTTYKY
jgi:hypothetical protein